MHSPGDVRGHNGREGGGQQPRGRALGDLVGEQVGAHGRVRREDGRDEHAHVADVDRQVQQVHRPVEHRGREHEAGVDGAADGAAQGVPAAVIEPVQELQEALVRQVLRGPEVEVRVELVDHGLVAHDREQADREGQQRDQAQDAVLKHRRDARQVLKQVRTR